MRLPVWIIVFLAVLISAVDAQAQDEADPDAITVTIGMYVNDVQAIDLRTHSYGVDFYLWFR